MTYFVPQIPFQSPDLTKPSFNRGLCYIFPIHALPVSLLMSKTITVFTQTPVIIIHGSVINNDPVCSPFSQQQLLLFDRHIILVDGMRCIIRRHQQIIHQHSFRQHAVIHVVVSVDYVCLVQELERFLQGSCTVLFAGKVLVYGVAVAKNQAVGVGAEIRGRLGAIVVYIQVRVGARFGQTIIRAAKIKNITFKY